MTCWGRAEKRESGLLLRKDLPLASQEGPRLLGGQAPWWLSEAGEKGVGCELKSSVAGTGRQRGWHKWLSLKG